MGRISNPFTLEFWHHSATRNPLDQYKGEIAPAVVRVDGGQSIHKQNFHGSKIPLPSCISPSGIQTQSSAIRGSTTPSQNSIIFSATLTLLMANSRSQWPHSWVALSSIILPHHL